MFFGFPFFFAIPLILPFLVIFMVFRVGSRLFRGITRRSYDSIEEIPPIDKELARRRSGSWEGMILNLAFRLKEKITLSDIIIETGLDMKEAEDIIDAMVDGTRVRLEVDPRGLVVYEFPEIIARFEEN